MVSVTPMLSINEGESVQVCATLVTMEYTERNFIIAVVTNDDTGANTKLTVLADIIVHAIGLGSFDYNAVSSNKTFTSGSINGAMKCVNITILDDNTLEGNQTFTVTYMTADSSIRLGANMTVITIMDDDSLLKQLFCHFK